MSESFLGNRVTLHCGDMADVLAGLPENNVDAVVCDPPYHLSSIVKRFGAEDAAPAKAGKTGAYARASAGFMGKQWDGGDVAFRISTWRAAYRVLKPGGHLVAFSGTRTYHRMACAIEDANFDIRDQLAWMYGSGFPKSHNIGDGRGTALKPAWEPIVLARKPLSESTVAANVLQWGTGALNIDACRVTAPEGSVVRMAHYETDADRGYGGGLKGGSRVEPQTAGRWPANILHDGSNEVVGAFPETKSGLYKPSHSDNGKAAGILGSMAGRERDAETYADTGSASRFFYTAKADADDRLGSRHPTVKPLDLMQYLCRLVTPKGGTVLDCFAGTGTTAEAAYRAGFNAVLIEREAEYQADIRRRMALVLAGPDERARESIKARGLAPDAGPLFSGALL